MSDLSRFAPGLFVLLWATGFIGARYAMPWSEPFHFLTVRFVLAFVLLAILVLATGRTLKSTPGAAFHAMVAGVLIHGVYLGGVFWAVRHGMPAGLSALIVGLQPLITAVMALVFLGDRVLPRQWAGLAVGFAGVLLVLQPAFGAAGDVTVATLSAAVIAVVGMSAGTIWQKRYVADMGLLASTVYQYAGAGIVIGALHLLLEEGRYTLTGELVFAMAWLVLVLSIGAIFLLTVLIRQGEIARVASLFYLVPGVTAVLAWYLFGEDLTPIQIVGMVIAAFGVAMASRANAPKPKSQSGNDGG